MAWLAAALVGLATLLIIVLQDEDQSGDEGPFCGTPGEEACSVPAPPCEAAAESDRNRDNDAVPSGEAAPLRNEGDPLPYGFNDAAPLIGQVSAAKDIELHEAVGSSVVRYVIDWGEVESEPNRFDFSITDEIYCAATRQNVDVVLTMTGIPPWAASARRVWGCPLRQAPGARLPTRAATVRGARGHPVSESGLRGVERAESALPFWPSPDPARYAALLEAIYDGVKDGSPRTAVLGGVVANSSTDGVPPGSLSLTTFLNQMFAAGGGQSTWTA